MQLKQKSPDASDELSPLLLDELWESSRAWRELPTGTSIDFALSDHERAGAKPLLMWILKAVREGNALDDAGRDYLIESLDRFFDDKSELTLGQAFGVERATRRNPPVRAGLSAAINGLIGYLHTERQYPITDSADSPTAFDVASKVLERHWNYRRSPNRLRDHWNKRKAG